MTMNKKYHMLSNIWMSFSEEEITRRHKALKEVMHRENLPAAIIFSHDGIMKSWLLGEWTQGFAGAGDILIEDGESYSVQDEFLHFRLLEEKENFEEYVTEANYKAVKHASRFSFVPIKEAFHRAGVCRLGIYRPHEMNIELARYLEKNLPGTTYVDMTESFDRIHMIRSREELSFSKKTVDILEKAFAAIPAVLSPGKTEYETINAIRAVANGCTFGDMNVYMLNHVKLVSNPDGQSFVDEVFCGEGKYIEKGDRVDIKFHCAAENWVFGMLSRSFILADKISEETQEKWKVAVEANLLCARLMKPGATLKEVAQKVNEYLVSRGSRPDESVFLYSLYNGVKEQPCLYDPSEEIGLVEGMLIGVAPTAEFENNAPMCCGDVYEITGDGAKRLGSFPMEMVAVKGL